jgi:hypothetical protein
MSIAPQVWSGHVVTASLRRRAVVVAVRPAGVGVATVRRWWSAWIAGSVVLPACAVASPATPCPDAILVPAVVLAAVFLAAAAALFTRITLAVAAAQDAALRHPPS